MNTEIENVIGFIAHELKKYHGFILPEEYKEFLRSNHNGLNSDGLRFFGVRELLRMNDGSYPWLRLGKFCGDVFIFDGCDGKNIYERLREETFTPAAKYSSFSDMLAAALESPKLRSKESIEEIKRFCGESPYFRVKPDSYEEVKPFRGGMAAVKTGGRWGYVSRRGNMPVPAVYKYAGDFVNGAAAVKFAGMNCLIDRSGKITLKTNYDELLPDKEISNLIIVRKGGRYGVTDKEGRIVAPIKYVGVGFFSEGLAVVGYGGQYTPAVGQFGEKYGYINTKGKEVIPLIYDSAEPFGGGCAEVCFGGKRMLIDKSGNVAKATEDFEIPGNIIVKKEKKSRPFAAEYDCIIGSYKNLTLAKKNGNVCLLNENGGNLLPFPCEDAEDFSEGLAWVSVGGLWGAVGEPESILEGAEENAKRT